MTTVTERLAETTSRAEQKTAALAAVVGAWEVYTAGGPTSGELRARASERQAFHGAVRHAVTVAGVPRVRVAEVLGVTPVRVGQILNPPRRSRARAA